MLVMGTSFDLPTVPGTIDQPEKTFRKKLDASGLIARIRAPFDAFEAKNPGAREPEVE
jgi:hypothetical protein